MIHINHFNPCYFNHKRWCYDWKIRSTTKFETFAAFAEWVIATANRRLTYADKELAPMYNFIQQRSILDEDVITSTLLNRKRNNKPNQVAMTVLALDYDSPDYSIEAFAEAFEEYEWVLHTTYNHLTERKKGAPCFRVLVQLSEPIPVEELSRDPYVASLVPALLNHWPNVDETCFQSDRAIFQPGFHPDRLNDVEVYHNPGKPFDWTHLPRSTPLVRLPTNRLPEQGTVGGSGRLLLGTMDLMRFFSDRGLYRSHASGNTHHVTCPNASAHSSGSASMIFDHGDHWGYNCQHAHCAPGNGKWLKDFIIQNEGIEALRPYCEAVPDKNLADLISRFKANPNQGLKQS